MKSLNDQMSNFLPGDGAYAAEILSGLSRRQKQISPKFLYDKRGSEIFEQICGLKEYYPTQSETEILHKKAKQMAALMGKNVILIEPGCGSCTKVRELLKVMIKPQAYVAMDISDEFLQETAARVQKDFKKIPVFPVAGDYTQKFSLPREVKKLGGRRVVFFPGSTIGNMNPPEAKKLLKKIGKMVRKGGGLLIGVDLKKDSKVLELAYDDPEGVTAEFNYNLLDRLNRDFSASFDRRFFQYSATYNQKKGRVEMFLVSQIPQTVRVGSKIFRLGKDETIHTEDSYKYSVPEFENLAKKAGFRLQKTWTDQRKFFCVYYLERT